MNGNQSNKANMSIVLYKTSEGEIQNIISSIEHIKIDYTLYIIDNSPTSELNKYFSNNERIKYIHNPSNPGFGAAHNIALRESIKQNIPYHFVINPDVIFYDDIITQMVKFMDEHNDIGMLMPQILNIDGSIQYLPKLLPSPLSLLKRKIKYPNNIYKKFINEYELRFVDKTEIYNAPIISGCFTLFRVGVLKEIGLYDDRYYMYFEDWDISRRIHAKYKTVYYPIVSAYHGYEAGANKSKRLFKIYLNSAYLYFTKWGWLFDKERRKVNRKALNQFNK